MNLQVHGNLERFALAFQLVEDPDQGGEPARRASWAKLQIWVSGRNLTAGIARGGSYLQEAQCPLLPIVQWLLENWDVLLHEERFPVRLEAHASAAWYMAMLGSSSAFDDSKMLDLMAKREAWWSHHGLGAALPDFRIPDLHFRRFAEMIELSWDDREWRAAGPGIELLEPQGAALLPVAEVAQTLVDWCRSVLDCLAEVPAAAASARALLQKLDELRSQGRQQSRLQLAAGIDIEGAARRLQKLAGVVGADIRKTVQSLLGMDDQGESGFYAVLPVPVLLYRSASPQLKDSDLLSLLQLANTAVARGSGEFESYRDPLRCPTVAIEATHQGCELALSLRERLGVPRGAPLTGEHDLENEYLRKRLGIHIEDVSLSDRDVGGVAILRPGCVPIAAVNLNRPSSAKRWGRRMTLAHELCHLLHDGGRQTPVGIVSNPWAPVILERRANAFAVTLLAPEAALERHLGRDSSKWDRSLLRQAMSQLGVGVTTLMWQLYNLEWISESEREAWVDELTMPEG